MSTDVPAAQPADASVAGQQIREAKWIWDLRRIRIVRFAVGVTVSVAISFGFDWPLYFLTPVLTAFLLALPLPAPTLRQSFNNILYVLAAFALGLVFTLFLLPYVLVYVPVLGLVLFHIYYLANRGGPVFLVVVSLLAVLILPMMGQAHDALAGVIALYFVWSAVLAIVLVSLSHGLFPDPPVEHKVPGRAGFQTGYSRTAALNALKSTIAVLPLATLFITFGWTSQLVILVFAAFFSLSPELSKGKQAALKSLTSTLIGGLAAIIFYYLIVAVPEFFFFVALMFLTTLLFGQGLYSDRPVAKYLSSAATALIVLIASSVGAEGSVTGQLLLRVMLIGAASAYIVAVFEIFERPRAQKNRKT